MSVLTDLSRSFLGWSPPAAHKPEEASRPNLEALEDRDVPSWTTVPTWLYWPSSTSVSFLSNARSGIGTVSNREVDVWNFYAPRSGTFTFNVGRYGSQIDTIAGLYNWNGYRIAGNDDSNGTTDSRFTAYLTGGTRYALAITNYTGTYNGAYRWTITGPPLSVSLYNNAGDGITSLGSAYLNGNSLRVNLYGWNRSNFYYYDHRIDVYLLNSSGRPIHSGSWSLRFRTGGTYVYGLPSYDSMTRTWDLSNWDLRALRNIRIVVH